MNTANGSVSDIYYTIFDTSGAQVKAVAKFTNDTPGYDERHDDPNLTQLAGGRFLLTWECHSDPTDLWDICFAVLDSAGNTIRGMTNASSTSASSFNVDAVALSNGNSVIAWHEWQSGQYRIAYTVLDAAYNVLLSPPTILSNPAAVTGDDYVSVAPAGNLVVLTWMDYDYDYRRNLYYALVDGNGNVLTDPMIFRTSQATDPYIFTSYEGYGNTSLSSEIAPPTITDVDYPAAWPPGTPVTVTWQVGGSWLQEVDLYWDTASHASDNAYANTAAAESLGSGQYRAVATMPASGYLYFKAHARNMGGEAWSAEHNIHAEWLRPLITSHVGGTTNETRPTLEGEAAAGSTVKVYDGASQIATTTASGDGTFAVTLPSLSEGTHVLTVRVSKGGVDSPPSLTLTLTVESNLKVDPIGVEGTTPGTPQHLRDEEGLARLGLTSRIWIRAGETVTFVLPVSGTNVLSTVVQLVGPAHFSQALPLEKDPADPELWSGSTTVPTTGLYTATVEINDGGDITDTPLASLVSDEEGRIRDRKTDLPLTGVQVTAWYSNTQTNRWEKWNGAPWGQQNPWITSGSGLYQFSPYPAGTYRIIAEKEKYWTYTSGPMEVTSDPLRVNVQLKPRYDVYLPLIMRNAW